MNKTKYLKNKTRRRTKKNKTKRGGMMKYITNAILPKQLNNKQSDLFKKLPMRSPERIHDILKYTKIQLYYLINETTNKTNRYNLIKIINTVDILLQNPDHHDEKLMKKLVQFPNMVEILTPIYKKVNKLRDISESIIPKGIEYTNKLLREFRSELLSKNMLNTNIEELIKKFIEGSLKILPYNYGTTWNGHINRIIYGGQIRLMLDSDDMYNEFKNFINSTNKYIELKEIVKDEDEVVNQTSNQTSNQPILKDESEVVVQSNEAIQTSN
jgi:hypothetical protein